MRLTRNLVVSVIFILFTPYFILVGLDWWRNLPDDEQFYVAAALIAGAIVLAFFRHWLPVLSAIAALPAGLFLTVWGAGHLLRTTNEEQFIFGSVVTLSGLVILFFAIRVLRPYLRRRRKAKPSASAKPVAPPVARVVQSQTQKTDRALPAPIADFLNKQDR